MDDPLYTSHRVTPRLAWATTICCLSTLQFGFHLAALNAPQEIISCRKHFAGPYPSYEDTIWSEYGRKECIPMTPTGIAIITTMFTVGGLVSSMVAGSHTVLSFLGRRRIQKVCALFYLVGSLLVACANSMMLINLGRFIAGLASGTSMVVAPILISELSPFNHRGLLGSLLQFGVAIGILTAQLIAMLWSNDQEWRFLFVFGAGLAAVQFVLLFTTVESPKWLIMHRGDISNATEILHTLRSDRLAMRHEIEHWRCLSNNSGSGPSDKLTETSQLLNDLEDIVPFVPLTVQKSRRGSIDPSTFTTGEYLSIPRYRKEWIAIALIMSAQQLCGMNAITFYGVSVLQNIVPDGTNVLILTSLLALCNVVSALVISPFIDKVGRRHLLLSSVAVMGTCSIFISYGLVKSLDYVAALGCFGFIVGFSLGLGQIPFLMVSELASHETIGIAQSYGTTLNWVANVAVAYLFPTLKQMLGGYVFLVFFGISVVYFIAIYIRVPETKGKLEYRDIWGTFYN